MSKKATEYKPGQLGAVRCGDYAHVEIDGALRSVRVTQHFPDGFSWVRRIVDGKEAETPDALRSTAEVSA